MEQQPTPLSGAPFAPTASTAQPNTASAAVHAQLTIYQGIIGRMATNSASCKTWCITIVSAILVVMADKQKGNYIFVAVVPIMLFYFLDSYYLHLERCFIASYNKFLKHVREGTATEEELFKIAPPKGVGTTCRGVGVSALSFATGPFYATLALVSIVAAVCLVGPAGARPDAGGVSKAPVSRPSVDR